MGDKLASKRTAMEANVNIIPGYDGIVKVPLYAMGTWLLSDYHFHDYRMLMKPSN